MKENYLGPQKVSFEAINTITTLVNILFPNFRFWVYQWRCSYRLGMGYQSTCKEQSYKSGKVTAPATPRRRDIAPPCLKPSHLQSCSAKHPHSLSPHFRCYTDSIYMESSAVTSPALNTRSRRPSSPDTNVTTVPHAAVQGALPFTLVTPAHSSAQQNGARGTSPQRSTPP